jgi:hypothetical protein
VSDDGGAAAATDAAEPGGDSATTDSAAKGSDAATGRGTTDGTDGPDQDAGLDSSIGDAFDKLAREAYERGRWVLDPTTVIAGRDAQVTVRTQLVLTGRAGISRSPGRMRAEQLEALRACYVAVPGYPTLLELLRNRHLLVLAGTPGSGRSTTAIRLLDDVAGGTVSRLDPAGAAVELDPQALEKGHGYLGVVAADARLSAVAADRFADALERSGAFSVLVVADDADAATALGAYTADCPAPDPHELVAQHLDAGLDPAAPPELGLRLLTLADSPRLRRALGPCPRTGEAAGMARLLLSHGRGEIGVEDVEAELAAFLDDQIARWFSVLDAPPHGERGERARRLSSLRIALAVFDGLPSYYATSVAEMLSAHLATPFVRPPTQRRTLHLAPAPTGRLPVLTGEDDRTLVASTRLDRVRTTAAFNGVEVPAEVLRFADPRTPSALLRHVWTRRPALRRPLLAWLGELSCDKRFVVRTRAAQAAGLLCSVDFAHTFTELIEPAARTPRRHVASPDQHDDDEDDLAGEVWRYRREFAALALDHAARDPAVHLVVRRTLRRWRRDKDPALQSTAATALGYDVGQADLEATLVELRVIGTPGEAEDFFTMRSGPVRDDWAKLLFTAGMSVARLFGTGGHRRVLRTLDDWLHDSRVNLRKLAVQAVVLMIEVPVSGLGRPEQEDADDLVQGDLSSGRDRWPALLALQDRHPEVVAPAADLVHGALRTPWRAVVDKVLVVWFDLAAGDDAALAAVESFLPLLVVEESDRARLRGLVRHRRRTWADPLPDRVADRLDGALARTAAAPSGGRMAFT